MGVVDWQGVMVLTLCTHVCNTHPLRSTPQSSNPLFRIAVTLRPLNTIASGCRSGTKGSMSRKMAHFFAVLMKLMFSYSKLALNHRWGVRTLPPILCCHR